MSPTLQTTTERKRAALAERLKQMAAQSKGAPLSYSQQRLWFLDQLQPGTSLYNVASVARVVGSLNSEWLESSINLIVRRHEALRTRFENSGEAPVQVVDRDVHIRLERHDLSGLDGAELEAQTAALIKEQVNRPFDLSNDRLLRVALIRQDANSQVLVIIMHHIISDEWSLKIFFRELATAYAAFASGAPAALPELSIQYSDFAAWQRRWLRGEILENQLGFWQAQFSGELPETELPLDRPRRTIPEFKGSTVTRVLGAGALHKLRSLAEKERSTLFMVLLSAFKCLVSRYTGQSDIVIGSPIAGRNRIEAEGLIGFFVNTLPLRTDLSGDPSFREALRRVRQVTLDAYAHQDLPFDRLVEELRPERSLAHMPFTRLMFTMQSELLERMELPGATLEFLDVEPETAKFDLTLVAQDTARGLVLKAEYDIDLFERQTVERLLEHLEIFVEAAVGSPEARLSQLPLLSAAERNLVVKQWNGTATHYRSDKCIHEVFEEVVARNPAAIALSFNERRLTYSELNSSANQVASYLRGQGVGPGIPVAICTRRSPELIVGILGVLKAGGAYVPLDPNYPRERLELMMRDTGARVLLTEQGLLADLPETDARRLCLDSDWELLAGESRQNPSNLCKPENLAYIMYTSGSTGVPKGVCVPHRAVNRLVLNTNYVTLTTSDRVAQVSNVSFDAATFEIWGALLNGAQLRKIGKDVALSPAEFATELRRQEITALFLTTALFNQIANDTPEAFSSLNTVMFGGEACDVKSIRKVLEHGKPVRLLHVYGPTENTTFSTWHLVDTVEPGAVTVPIGAPISNTQALVLDQWMNPAPIGVPGELFVGGEGLADGYWKREDLTKKFFVANPFEREGCEGSRLYKTGDLVRWLPGGKIEFLGRIDNQVKIRGFRVEPGEIEAALSQHPLVSECAVTLHGSGSATRRLVGYIIPEGQAQINWSELRAFLKQKLPDYMVPSAFVSLNSLPLTPNGKVNRAALPAPDQTRPELERGYVAARDDIEKKLAQIWEAVLGVHPIGVQDKFFDLGGHSLLAVKLVSKIEKAFGRKLRLATIFQASTIEQLASVLREDVRESSLTSRTSLVDVQAKGSRPPLFLVHGAGGGMFWGYVNLSKHLGPDQPVYGFRSRGLDGLEEFDTIEQLASHYVQDLRRFQPQGPYYLGGYCFGGNVAYEMACQLEAAGQKVALLALINAAPANSKYLQVPWTPVWVGRFAKNMVYYGKYVLSWSATQRREFFAWKLNVLARRLRNLKHTRNGEQPKVDPANLVDLSNYSEDQKKVWEAHVRALIKYHPRPYSGSVHLLRSGGHPLWCSFEPDYGWGELVDGRVQISIVPGAHEKVLEEPCVVDVAKRIAALIEDPAGTSSQVSMNVVAAAAEGVAVAGIGFMAPELSEALSGGAAVLGASIGSAVLSGRQRSGRTGCEPMPDLKELESWNATRQDLDLSRSFSFHFAESVRRFPASPAVVYRGASLSYAELNERANRIAGRMAGLGVKPGALVAVCLERTPDLIAAILAAWKNGAAYLPLDPKYPVERLSYMLQDSRATVLVTQTEHASLFPDAGIAKLVIDDPAEQEKIAALAPVFAERDSKSGALAYVIYTSGSTGRPKGVEITHSSLLNHNRAVISAYGLSGNDRILQFSPISFDISVEEIFPTLLCGGTLVLRTDEVISSVDAFLTFVAQERVSVLNLPTAYWHQIVEDLPTLALPESLRIVVIGGEKASDEAFRKWKRSVPAAKVTLINSYGPTEATVTATYFTPGPDDETLPIGKPLANVQVAVLDHEMQRVPIGEQGELCIGGNGLARGYLDRPELTAQRFVKNPFPDIRSERLYRTGDLVRFRPDGNLEFLGRVDDQVKIRGFRIELGEIESTLLTHPKVRDAVVLAREDRPGEKKLVAYVVARNGEIPHTTELFEFLRRQIPAYMVPSGFVQMDAFPMTPAGKVDRRALPAPGRSRPRLDQIYVAPRTPLEAVIASIYSDVLDFDKVGVFDDFFELGGHSLSATQVIGRIREALRTEVSLAVIFGQPTVAGVAAHIESVSGGMLSLPFSLIPGARRVELSPDQARIWFLDQYDPRQSPYNLPIALRMTGPLSVPALEWSLKELSARHEALRSVFPEEDGSPVQYVLEPGPVALPQIDLSDRAPADRENEAAEICSKEGRRNHIKTKALLNPLLIRLSERDHILVIVLNEIASDHVSKRIVLTELSELYDARVSVRRAVLPVAHSSVSARNHRLHAEERESLEHYWKETLSGAPELLELPGDYPRSANGSDDGALVRVKLPQRVNNLLGRPGASQESLLLAAFTAVLHRYTGRRDIVLGTTIQRRPQGMAEGLVGRFEDYLVLRQAIPEHVTFGDLVQTAEATLKEARAHGQLPFSRIVELVNPERHASYTPIFQVLFHFHDEQDLFACPGGVSIVPLEPDHKASTRDLSFTVRRTPRGYNVVIQYSTALFDADRIERLVQHFAELLLAGLEDPFRLLAELPLMQAEEHELVLGEWNRTERPYASDKTLIRLFDEQVGRMPESEALVCGTERITYKALSDISARIAERLRALGVGTEGKVALCMERSKELVAAILGTFRTGAAYVPIDPSYPKDRIEYMLADSNASVLLTERKFAGTLPSGNASVLCIEDIDLNAPMCGTELSGPAAADLAYIIYTSGSTGKPKGVMIEHRNAVAFIHWAKDAFDSEELSGVLAATSVCFDLSIFELFAPLCWGGRVILAKNALELPMLPCSNEVRLINTVPSAMRELVRAGGVPESVRTVNLAGEPLPTTLVDAIYSKTKARRVLDLYGPTETTTYSTWAARESGAPATIGRPLTNQQIYLLDANRQPVPIGIPGEVYIGGSGVARGYLNRPELTAEKFVQSPFSEGERLYRTGDLARWRKDGNLEYLGRIDHQVKIRGFRIELGEIEAALRSHPAVSSAVVIARESGDAGKSLVAYAGLNNGKTATAAELQALLESRLPGYMVPPVIMVLEALPLTPNGKIDRKALPSPETVREVTAGIVEPRTETESRLCEIWKAVLASGRVGVTDNFFDLGGHSLLAIRIVSHARESMGIELPLFAIFDDPTVEALARKIDQGKWSSTAHQDSLVTRVSRESALQASFVQERLWFLDQLNPGSDAYNMPVALRLRGQLDCERLQRAFDRVLARHEALRTTFAFSEDSLVQKIAPEAEVRIETVDLSGVGSEGRDQTLNAMIQATASKSFDLAFGPLIRAVLFRLEPEEHVLLFCMHHTVSDGWSLAILFKELEAFYIANAAPEQEAGLPSLPVQYADYARWQRERMTGRALESELNYWRDSMRGAPSEIRFPSARRSSEKVERLTIDFPEAFVKLLGQKAQESGTTPFGMLMAALNLALARWTGQTDLVIGTVVAGRNRREFEHLIGCFMNFLPIRTQVRMDATGAEFVKDMRNRLLQAQTHQDCPFEKIVEALNPARKGDSNPLYNVAFLWQNFPHDLFEAEGLKSSTVPVAPSAALLDLRFEAEQEGNKLSLMCEFRSGMFRAEAIQALLESLLATAETLICEPDKRVETIKIDDRLIGAPAELETQKPAEGKLAICGTFTAEPVAESVQYWLNELGLTLGVEFAPYSQVFQELLTPESLLGQNNTGCNVSLIRLEDWLGEKKSRREDYGPALERNASEFISALRALAARNPAPHIVCVCPPSRKAASDPALRELFIAKEELLRKEVSALPGVHLLTAGEIMTWYPVQNYDDPAAEELGHVPYTPMFYTALGTALVRKLHAIKRAPAKVIVLDCDHTIWSGVCGEDGCNCIKVEGPWKALQEFMRAQRDSGMLLALCSKNNPEDVEEVFARRKDMPLLREHFAAVRLNWRPKSENLRSMAAELNLGLDSFVFFDDNPVECAEVEANCPEVLTLQLPEDPATIPAFLQHCWIFDHAKITAEDRKRAEMYRQNSERERLRSQSSGLADFIASLDLKVQIAPMEESSVERVAQLTQRTNQFNMTTRRRTEPEVRTLPAGTKVLTVKVADRFGDYGLVGVLIYSVHGESLDIDTFLLSCRVLGRGVEHKMLSRIGEIAREQRLRWVDLHYAATAKNKPALNFLESTAGSFKQHVNAGLLFRLPAGFASEVTFNVQSQASPHEAMQDAAPQPKSDSTPRFKACRTIAMRGGDIARVHRRIENRNQQTGETREVAALPETELERTLAGMWSRLLRRDDIGATDNFFDLGGHSLLAVRLFAEIERATGRKLPLVTLFQAPTVRELATVLQRERQHKPAGVEALLVPIQPQGDLPPLFLVHGAGGDVLWGYANLAGHLGNDRPIYGVKSRGQIGLEECSTIPEMAACYVEALRSRQPHGPYYLGGYCFGGNVAYEMARVLRAAGEEVAMIALLDSSPSNAGYEEVNWKSLQFICRFLRNSMFWLQDFAQQPFKDQVRFVSRKGHVVGRKLRDKLSGRTLPKVDLEEVIDPVNFPEHELKLWQTHLQALVDHVEQTYDGSVKLFRTRGQPVLCSFADDFCWGKVVRGGVEIIRIPGSHENIFMEPNVEVLASELAKALRVPQSAQMVKEEAFV